MARIEVFECDHTGKIFYGIHRYRAHLRQLAGDRIQKRKTKKAQAERATKALELKKCSSFEQIAKWIVDNADLLRRASLRDDAWRRFEEKPFSLTEVEFYEMHWKSDIYTNERGHGSGFKGRMYFKLHGHSMFELFDGLIFETGSGSGNSHTGNHGYEVYFYDEDWPLLRLIHEVGKVA